MRRALLLVALVLPLAACGGGGGSSSTGATLSPLASVKSAAKKSSAAPSEHMTVNGYVTVNKQAVTVRGSGDFDNEKHVGSVHADVNVGGLGAALDAVLDGTSFYFKSPLFADILPKGKTWLKLDLQKLGASQGIDFSALLSQDPTQAFTQLRAAGDMKEVGDETIDGAETTHYRGHVDLSKLPQGAKIAAATKAKYGPYDIWVGKDDGYVHRVRTTYSYVTAGAGRQTATSTTTFSDFGKDVSVDVPSDAESYDATNASMGGLGS
jgi:hypothetical protein